jgi:hypothetical protein
MILKNDTLNQYCCAIKKLPIKSPNNYFRFYKMFKKSFWGKSAAFMACTAITQVLFADSASLESKVAELEARLESMSEKMETSSKSSFGDKLHINGYGELHVNQLEGKGGALNTKEIDFHRFVLGFNVDFSEKIRFVSELELEHAIASQTTKGEIELEQAYIEMDVADHHRLKAGVFLVPVGLVNESHEPPVFYGVERNPVEKNIIPATWWEGGIGLSGEMGQGWGYDVAITSGLSSNVSYDVRKGRQKVGSAPMENPAYTGRVRYKGIPGLELGVTVQYQSDLRQKQAASSSVSAVLYEGHFDYHRGAFGIRGLYAAWDIDGTSITPGTEEQKGFYIEPTYRISKSFGVFYRYNNYDNSAGVSGTSEKVQHDIGLNYWPHEQVVFKIDYQQQDNENGKDQNGFNLGVGYAF